MAAGGGAADGNKEWVLVSYPEGAPTAASFELRDAPMPAAPEGGVVVKVNWLSVDPYQRARMRPQGSGYFGPYPLGEMLTGAIAGEVVESKAAGLPVGTQCVMQGTGPYARYFAAPAAAVTPIDTRVAPAKDFIGLLGITGLSAYFPIEEWGKGLKEGDWAFVSGAAGAVGSVACQLLAAKGVRVIGSAGSDDKVAFLREIGCAAAFNYKTTDTLAFLRDTLREAGSPGLALYYDNVGGETLDAALAAMATGGTVIACGSISQYNKPGDEVYGVKNFFMVVTKQLSIHGFLVTRWRERFVEGIGALARMTAAGKLRFRETVLEGIEAMPEAFAGLFSGANTGKMLVHVA